MGHEAYQEWLESRESYRYLLYGNEGGLIPALGDIATPSMAELAANETGRRLHTTEVYAEGEIREAVYNILVCHDETASRRAGKGIFSFINPDDLPYIANLTTGVVVRWERACQHQGVPSPFEDLVVERVRAKDFERTDVQLVVEAASVVMEMVQLGFGTNRKVETTPAELLVNFIARRGPHFASRWVSGDIIREHCEARKLNPDTYLALLGRRSLVYYALNNARSPLDAAISFVDRFHEDLSIANLSVELGWEEDKVKAVSGSS